MAPTAGTQTVATGEIPAQTRHPEAIWLTLRRIKIREVFISLNFNLRGLNLLYFLLTKVRLFDSGIHFCVDLKFLYLYFLRIFIL